MAFGNFRSFGPSLGAPNSFMGKRNIMRKMIKTIKPAKLKVGKLKSMGTSKGKTSGIAGNPKALTSLSPKGMNTVGGFGSGLGSASSFGDGGGNNLGTTGVF